MLLATRQGMAIRFSEDEARPMGRAAAGVKGLDVEPADAVIAAEVVQEGAAILTVTERGYGKQTPLEEYRLQGRGGKGILDIKTGGRNGLVVGLVQVREGDDILLVTTKGKLIRFAAQDVSSQGRNTWGVRVIDVETDDRVVSLARVEAERGAMLDPRIVREQPDRVEASAKARGARSRSEEYLDADARRRDVLRDVEERKARRNRASEAIAAAKRRGEDAAAAIAESRLIGDEIQDLDRQIRTLDDELGALGLQFPNLLHPDVPPGLTDEENVEVRRVGTPRAFRFAPRPHWEVGEILGILDFERGSRLAKSRFAVLWGPGRGSSARSRASCSSSTRRRTATARSGSPHLVNAETMVGTAQLPKFEDDLFKTVEPEHGRPLFLIPTAEVPLTDLHAGEILPGDACRGSTRRTRRASARGRLLRQGHARASSASTSSTRSSWSSSTTPETSYAELEAMVQDAEAVLQRLELQYRVVLLCTGDMGFSAAKTYDLEVWLPAQQRYREISSCSNCEDFQARRAEPPLPAGGRRQARARFTR